MAPDMKRFLTARFLTMVGWVILLVAGFAAFSSITSRIDSDPLRWVTNLVTLSGSIKLGLILQNLVLAHVDPDGTLRAQVAKLGSDAEDEEVPERCPERRDQP